MTKLVLECYGIDINRTEYFECYQRGMELTEIFSKVFGYDERSLVLAIIDAKDSGFSDVAARYLGALHSILIREHNKRKGIKAVKDEQVSL